MKSINYAAHNGDNFPNGKNKYLTFRIINILQEYPGIQVI